MTEAESETAAGAGLGLPTWILLFLFAVVPVVFATGFSQFEILKEGVLVGGVGVALAVWAVVVVRDGRVSITAGRVVILAVAGALFAAASTFWSPGLLYGAVSVTSIVSLVGIVLLVAAPVGRPMRFLEFATAVATGMALASVTGLLDLAGVGLFTLIWDPPGYTGVFDAMEFAVPYYAVALPVAVAGTHYADGSRRIGFGVASLLGAAHFGLVANWTYVGHFAAACAAIAVLIVLVEGVETLTVLTPIGVMVGLVLLVNLVAGTLLAGPSEPTDATELPLYQSPPGIQEGAVEDRAIRNPAFSIDRMESVRSLETRAYLADVSLELIKERPIFGHGAGAWWRLQTKAPNVEHPAVQSQFTHYPAFRSPHNVLSKLLVEYGVLGFALFLLWLIGCAWIAFGALDRSGEHADLIIEQWGLCAASLGGALFALITPVVELAPAAAVWVGGIAVLTRRSAEVNEYAGASMQWRLGDDEPAGGFARTTIGGLAALLGVGMLLAATFDSVSRLYRGWGDHLMLRTYYKRAIDRYEAADEWMPIHGGAIYNIALAKSRLGTLGAGVPERGESTSESNETTPSDREESASPGGAEAGGSKTPDVEPRTDGSSAPEGGDAGPVPPSGSDTGGRSPDGGAPSESTNPRADAGSSARGGDSKKPVERDRPKSRMDRLEGTPGYRLLSRCVRMRPYDARPLTLFAEFYVRSGLSSESLEYARRAISAAPNSIRARKSLATGLQALGRLDPAAKELLKALEREPPRRHRYVLHYQLARLYFRGLQELAHAKEHFQKAKENAPGRTARRKMNKQIKAVEKRIKHKRRMREGKMPEGTPEKVPGK